MSCREAAGAIVTNTPLIFMLGTQLVVITQRDLEGVSSSGNFWLES